MKKVLTMIVVLALVLSCAVCGFAESEKKMVYAVGPSGDVIWDQWIQGLEDASAECGYDFQYVNIPDLSNYDATCAPLLETGITNGADILVGLIIDYPMYDELFRRAHDAGIVTVATNAGWVDQMEGAVDFAVSIDPVSIGHTQVEALQDAVGDNEANMIFMRSQFANPAQTIIWETINELLKDSPNIKVLDQYESLADSVRAAQIITDVRKVDDVNAVIMNDGAGTVGVGNYISENHLEDEIFMVGIDYNEQSLQFTKDGVIDRLVTQNWYNVGYQSVAKAKELIEGGEVPNFVDAGTEVLTAETAADFALTLGYTLK